MIDIQIQVGSWGKPFIVLDPDDDELTRTRKVRRKFVAERYKDLIDALYGEEEELRVEADIRYQDGKGFRMKTTVRVKQVEDME